MKKILKLLLKYKQIILYIIVGLATTIVNVVSYIFLSSRGLTVVNSNILSWLISVLFSYIANKIWVFKNDKKGFIHIFKELLIFVVSRITTGVLDTTIMKVYVDIFMYDERIVKIISNIIVIVLNYILSKVIIFKKR